MLLALVLQHYVGMHGKHYDAYMYITQDRTSYMRQVCYVWHCCVRDAGQLHLCNDVLTC